MTTSDLDLQVPARPRGPTLGLRISILVLDFAAIITLSVSLGLYFKWIPHTSYPTTALKPTRHTDWTDLVVLTAILVSFLSTGYITIRPTWTSKALHRGCYVAFEFVSLAWLLAFTIPAFIHRESGFKNLAAISNTCDMSSVTLMNGDKVPWVCMPHLNTLKKLQIASYSVACAVAVLHFSLFSLACYSIKNHPRGDSAETTPSQSVGNDPKTPNIAQQSKHAATTRERKLFNTNFELLRFLHRGELAVPEPQPRHNPPSVPSPLACRPGAFVSTLAVFRNSALEIS